MKNFKEYNEKVFPLAERTRSLLNYSLEHAIEKAGASVEEVMHHLEPAGWNNEWKAFVLRAVEHYRKHLIEQVQDEQVPWAKDYFRQMAENGDYSEKVASYAKLAVEAFEQSKFPTHAIQITVRKTNGHRAELWFADSYEVLAAIADGLICEEDKILLVVQDGLVLFSALDSVDQLALKDLADFFA